jgi:hypothetical protein
MAGANILDESSFDVRCVPRRVGDKKKNPIKAKQAPALMGLYPAREIGGSADVNDGAPRHEEVNEGISLRLKLVEVVTNLRELEWYEFAFHELAAFLPVRGV